MNWSGNGRSDLLKKGQVIRAEITPGANANHFPGPNKLVTLARQNPKPSYMKRPLLLYPLVLLHLLLGAGALYGGFMLLTNPINFGMRPEWLNGSPFNSYLIPGLFLFVFLGIVPLIVATGLVRRAAFPLIYAFNFYRDRHWAWTFSLLTGILLIGWINVQIALVPYFWMQPLFLAVGLLILILTLWPSVMRYFKKGK